MRRSLEYVPLNELRQAKRNPKQHRLDVLGESLGKRGLLSPLIVDDRTGLLIAGHGRREAFIAARDRGDPAPEGVVVDGEGEWTVPVVRGWRSKSDAEAEAALLADNQVTMLAGFDEALLAAMLPDLADAQVLAGTGFEDPRELAAKVGHEEPVADPVEAMKPGARALAVLTLAIERLEAYQLSTEEEALSDALELLRWARDGGVPSTGKLRDDVLRAIVTGQAPT